MQIDKISAWRVELPLVEGRYSWSNNNFVDTFDTTVVEIATDTGQRGYGECCPLGSSYLPAYAEGVRAGLREIAEETLHLPDLEQDLVKSLSRVPEPEPVDEEVLDLIPTDQNIFGLQDVSAEEEAAALAAESEEMTPEDIQAAIEAELAGKTRR